MLNIRKLEKAIEFLERIETILAIIIIIFIILINTFEIIGRYFFSKPLGWAHELSLYLIIWVTYFSVSILVKRRELIALDFFYVKFSENRKRIITLSYNIMLLIASVIMIRYSLPLEKIQRARDLATLNLPQAIGLYGFIIPLLSIVFTVSIYLYKDIFNYTINSNSSLLHIKSIEL